MEEKWKRIHGNLPRKAKYTLPDIQNEVIEALASLVKNKIAEDVRKAELFTIMANRELIKTERKSKVLFAAIYFPTGK